MFRGINEINVDEKGRVAMPTRYRQRLQDEAGGQLILTIDTEQRCLLLYSLQEWQKIEQKIAELPSFQPATRRIQRLLIGHATELELDSHGRLLLPQLLREYANIGKNLVLLGQGNKFELWDDAHWQKVRDAWLSEHDQTDWPDELKRLSL